MADFLAIQAASYDYAKGIHVLSADIPDELVDALRREEPVDLWWVRTTPQDDEYKIVAKVRYCDYRLNRGTQFESWSLNPDPAASFKVEGGVLDAPPVTIESERITGRYSIVGEKLRLKLLASLDGLFGISIGGLAGRQVPAELPPPADGLLATAKVQLADLLRRPLSSGSFKRKEAVKGRLSGIGCALFDVLDKAGVEYLQAWAVASALDPLKSATVDWKPKGKNPRLFRPLTLGAILSRNFADPSASAPSMDKSRRAERIHQEIVRRIFSLFSKNQLFDIVDSEFIDLALVERGVPGRPTHIFEVKTILGDNLESQVEKGIIQLARMQFYFGRDGVQYHLVLEKTGATPDDWLEAIISQFGLKIHYFDLERDGEDACPSIVEAVRCHSANSAKFA